MLKDMPSIWKKITVFRIIIIAWFSAEMVTRFLGLPFGMMQLVFSSLTLLVLQFDLLPLMIPVVIVSWACPILLVRFFFMRACYCFDARKPDHPLVEHFKTTFKNNNLSILPGRLRKDPYLFIVIAWYIVGPILIFTIFNLGDFKAFTIFIWMDFDDPKSATLLICLAIVSGLLLFGFLARMVSVARFIVTPLDPEYQYTPDSDGYLPLVKVFFYIDLAIIQRRDVSVLIRKPLDDSASDPEASLIHRRVCERYFLPIILATSSTWRFFASFTRHLELKTITSIGRLNESVETIKEAYKEYHAAIAENLSENITPETMFSKVYSEKHVMPLLAPVIRQMPDFLVRFIYDIEKCMQARAFYAFKVLLKQSLVMSIQHVIQLRNGTEANPEGLVKPEASMDSLVFLTRQEKLDLEKFMAKLDDPADFAKDPADLQPRFGSLLDEFMKQLRTLYVLFV